MTDTWTGIGSELTEDGILFMDDVQVQLIDSMGDDSSVRRAARVSTKVTHGIDEEEKFFGVYPATDEGEAQMNADREAFEKKNFGLINYLMRNKHGSPFEHVAFTFRIEAPIFVFREWHRHRAGWSYNEQSGRYTQFKPRFYVPSDKRPLVNVGTSSKPEMGPADRDTQLVVDTIVKGSMINSWNRYQSLIDLGIANEVARIVLPTSIMSTMYATTNARALMHFLSLRTKDDSAAFVSRPQLEIEMAARKMEAIFAAKMPDTYKAWQDHGRVAP